LCPAAVLAAALALSPCLPTAAGDKAEPPKGPVKVTKWSMRWDRFSKKGMVEASFKNNSPKRISKVNVNLEFLDDAGKIAKRASWYSSVIYSFGTGRMKRTMFNCPIFQRYRIRLTAEQEGEPIEQYFEGRYWPDKPGDNPELPKEIVLAQGEADVRVIASREELKKKGKKKESLTITGTVQNLGDCPAEKIQVVVKLLLEGTTAPKKKQKKTVKRDKKGRKIEEKEEKKDGKNVKTVRELRCGVPTSRLEPNRTASFKVFLNQVPDHNKYDYEVEFDSIGGPPVAKEESEAKAFELQAGPLLLKDCTIGKDDGLLKGTLINQGKKKVYDIVISVRIERKKKTTTHEIKPGRGIEPGEEVELVELTTAGYEKFAIDIAFQEQE
jgi:hypothetical protein